MRLRSVCPLMLCALSLSNMVPSPLAAKCPNAAPRVSVQQGNGQIQVQVLLNPAPCEETHGPWLPLREAGVYREYTYRIDGQLKRHYLIWLPHEPTRCYCYNRETGKYWGRWNKEGQQTTFTKATHKSSTVTETIFEQRTSIPTAPETQVPMTPPPSFPSDLPADVR